MRTIIFLITITAMLCVRSTPIAAQQWIIDAEKQIDEYSKQIFVQPYQNSALPQGVYLLKVYTDI